MHIIFMRAKMKLIRGTNGVQCPCIKPQKHVSVIDDIVPYAWILHRPVLS